MGIKGDGGRRERHLIMQFSTVAAFAFAAVSAHEAVNTTANSTNVTGSGNATNSTGSGNSTKTTSSDSTMLGSQVLLAVAAAIAGSL